LLRKEVSWNDVESSSILVTKVSGRKFDGNELFTQAMCVKRYATADTIDRWRDEAKNAEAKWMEIFQHFTQ
jgi:hypothetical protein